MRLSAKPIISWCNVNMFSYGNQWTVRAGDPLTLYFQLVDLDQGPYAVIGNLNLYQNSGVLTGTTGLRYVAGVGANAPASLVVTFPSTDSSRVITANATQDPNDGSIWSITIPAPAVGAPVPNSGNVIFALSEIAAPNTITRKFSVTNMLAVEFPGANGSC